MRVDGPDSKYAMRWKGEWRAVVHLLDHANRETTFTTRAAEAVLYVTEDYWIACVVGPGDLAERTDRDPNRRDWDYIRD